MVFLAGMLLAGDLLAADPVALRIESLTVPPATQPLIYVTINNRSESPYQGEITLKPPPQ